MEPEGATAEGEAADALPAGGEPGSSAPEAAVADAGWDGVT